MTLEDLNRLTFTLEHIGESIDELIKLHKYISESLNAISNELSYEVSKGLEKPGNSGKLPSKIECKSCKYYIPCLRGTEDAELGINRCYLKQRVITTNEQKSCKTYRAFKPSKELYDVNKIPGILNIKMPLLLRALDLLGVTPPTEEGQNEWGVLKPSSNGVYKFLLNEFTLNCVRNITRWNECTIIYLNNERVDKFQYYSKVLDTSTSVSAIDVVPTKKTSKKKISKMEPAKKEPAKKELVKKEPAKKEPAKPNTQNKRGSTKKD